MCSDRGDVLWSTMCPAVGLLSHHLHVSDQAHAGKNWAGFWRQREKSWNLSFHPSIMTLDKSYNLNAG